MSRFIPYPFECKCGEFFTMQETWIYCPFCGSKFGERKDGFSEGGG